MSTQRNKESSWFGFTKVDPAQKARMVEDVFDSVASRYDLMNDLMSAGIHRIWKKKFVDMMRPHADKSLLDVAGGTGDISFRYRASAGENADITVCDINKEMLKVGKDRAIDRGYIKGFEWIAGNAETLPFQDDRFNTYSISFGLRNVTRIDNALAEAWRVLKPGGKFFCLEFSQIKNKPLRKVYDSWSFHAIPRIGKLITNDSSSYEYLVESIRQFPKPDALCERILNAGFDRAKSIPLSGGIACIHIGEKH